VFVGCSRCRKARSLWYVPNINLNYQELDAAAARLQDARSQVEAILAVLRAGVAGMPFTGRAAETFAGLQNSAIASAADLLGQLDTMSASLRQASDAYRELDSKVAQSFGP